MYSYQAEVENSLSLPKIPQMKYTVYLFDFDYTLADSSRGIVTCFRSVLDMATPVSLMI